MNNRRAAEALVKSLDPDHFLGKNSRHVYKADIIRVMDNIVRDVEYSKKKKEAQRNDTLRFSQWADSRCPLLSGLKIVLQEEGMLQQPEVELPCQCTPTSTFCYEYENEYRMHLRMNKGKRTVVHLDYVFSQTQRPPRNWNVRFDECDYQIKKNVIHVNYFPGKTSKEVLQAIQRFIAAFCEETVEDFIQLPTSRNASPTRQ
jgi:hypothetical protein